MTKRSGRCWLSTVSVSHSINPSCFLSFFLVEPELEPISAKQSVKKKKNICQKIGTKFVWQTMSDTLDFKLEPLFPPFFHSFSLDFGLFDDFFSFFISFFLFEPEFFFCYFEIVDGPTGSNGRRCNRIKSSANRLIVLSSTLSRYIIHGYYLAYIFIFIYIYRYGYRYTCINMYQSINSIWLIRFITIISISCFYQIHCFLLMKFNWLAVWMNEMSKSCDDWFQQSIQQWTTLASMIAGSCAFKFSSWISRVVNFNPDLIRQIIGLA